MNARFLKLFVLALLPAMTAGPIYASSASPTCYSDVNSFMEKNYGPDFRDDENLKLKPVVYGKFKFYLFQDFTSGTNHSFVLLRKNIKKEICVVLSTPTTAQLELTKTDGAGVPLEFRTVDQASPGFPENEVFYRLTGASDYIASLCNTLTWKGNIVIRKKVVCSAR
jgi:hypothetical protein